MLNGQYIVIRDGLGVVQCISYDVRRKEITARIVTMHIKDGKETGNETTLSLNADELQAVVNEMRTIAQSTRPKSRKAGVNRTGDKRVPSEVTLVNKGGSR